MRLWPAIALVAACGRGSGTAAGPVREDGGTKAASGIVASRVTTAPLVLGLPALSAFNYRKGPGQPAFRRARASEAAGAWAEVAAACREALAADPAHLDAAYLLAVALAKTGAAADAIAAPLTIAVAGDFVKWGAAALAQPALQPFLATPLGTAWQTRATEARTQHATTLARSLVVGSRGDYYAYDREASRFHRLTRTGGAVVAMFRTPKVSKLVYVTHERRKGEKHIGIGLVDLATSRSKKLAYLAMPGDSLRVAYSTTRNAFVVLGKTAFVIDDTGDAVQLQAVPAKEHAAAASLVDKSWLDLTGRRAQLVRLQLLNIAADVDTQHLASALKIQSSKRVVTVPSPGLIDTNTVAWSPDRSQVAFIALRSDACRSGEQDTAVFVADMATGTAREIERAVSAMAFDWVADRTLAIVGDHGVAIHTVAGDSVPIAIEGGDALSSPKRRPVCTAEPISEQEIAVEADDDL